MARSKKNAAVGKRKRSKCTKKKTPGAADIDQEESGSKRPAITKIDGSTEDVGNKVGTFFWIVLIFYHFCQ